MRRPTLARVSYYRQHLSNFSSYPRRMDTLQLLRKDPLRRSTSLNPRLPRRNARQQQRMDRNLSQLHHRRLQRRP